MKKWIVCIILTTLTLLTLTLIGWELNASSAQARALDPASGSRRPDLPTGTIINSDITVDTIWTTAGSPYQLTAIIKVYEGVTLTVMPGVQVVVDPDAGLYVMGNLIAKGTSLQPILFTGSNKTPGSWRGLEMFGSQDMPVTAAFDYVTLEYGGLAAISMPANLKLEDAVITMTNSIVRYSGADGISNYGGFFTDNATSLFLDNVQFTGNQGSAVYCADPYCNIKAQNLSASGNGHDTLTYTSHLRGAVVWPKTGIDYLVQVTLVVDTNAVLTIDPGVKVQFDQYASLNVDGGLIAAGTPTQPITFTGSIPEPGWWTGINLGMYGSGLLDLYYCDIGYADINLSLYNNSASIRNCRIHDSSIYGIWNIENSLPWIHYNRFEGNDLAIYQNFDSSLELDARYNWWGDPSGPYATTNPGGVGDEVSDKVTFQPWLTSPDQTSPPKEIILDLTGPNTFAPGSTHSFAAQYSNETNQTIEDAVLRLALPANAEYLDNIVGGILYPEIRQVFWKLGDLAPGARGIVAVRVRFDWGLPFGIKDTVFAQISGSNLPTPPFDVTEYLNYTPNPVTSRVDLTPSQVQADRLLYPELNQLFTQAEGQGYVYGSAQTLSYLQGQQKSVYILLRFNPEFTTLVLMRGADGVMAEKIDGSSATIGNLAQNVRYSLQTGEWTATGGTGILGLAAPQAMTWADCMKNCIEEQLPGYLITKYIKVLGTISDMVSCYEAANGNEDEILGCSNMIADKIPGYGEAVALGICNKDCQDCVQAGEECNDDRCHCCKTDKYRCDSGSFPYGWYGVDVIKIRRCSDGKYLAEEDQTICTLCQKCVEDGAPHCTSKNLMAAAVEVSYPQATSRVDLSTAPYAPSATEDSDCPECQAAKDPNEMYGPQGDLLPGQLVTYTIEYENVGAGEAYGVFIANSLSPSFDLGTLHVISGSASLSSATQNIYFEVGDLAPKGEPGSKGSVGYSVRLKGGLASGTLIQNQAVVHFPSVPEETPTNPVINSIQPLRADPQSLQTTGTQLVSFHLTGKDAGGLPITFAIVEGPFYGVLSGTPPNLSYVAREGFSGRDRVVFTAGNGSASSRPAEISIDVLPDPNDKTIPQVVWVSPAAASTVTISADPIPSPDGSIYQPMIQARFSEALDPATVNGQTVTVSRGGSPVAASMRYDPVTTQLVIYVKTAPPEASTLTVTIGTGVKDLAGNPLAAPYTWSFQVLTAGPSGSTIYLPVVVK